MALSEYDQMVFDHSHQKRIDDHKRIQQTLAKVRELNKQAEMDRVGVLFTADTEEVIQETATKPRLNGWDWVAHGYKPTGRW